MRGVSSLLFGGGVVRTWLVGTAGLVHGCEAVDTCWVCGVVIAPVQACPHTSLVKHGGVGDAGGGGGGRESRRRGHVGGGVVVLQLL